MKVYVNYEDSRWKKYNIDFDKIASAAISAGHKDSEVSITLVDDKQIHKLNKQYRGMDKPTNVLSFANIDDCDFKDIIQQTSVVEMGDIIIALQTMQQESSEKKISLHNHFCHLLTHGVLHLLGYDHIDDEEADLMERLEIEILQKLNIDNPYKE